MLITKKQIILRLRELGYKANYKNTLISTFNTHGYVLVIRNGHELCKISRKELCL